MAGIVCRSDRPLGNSLKKKIALMCDVDVTGVVSALDAVLAGDRAIQHRAHRVGVAPGVAQAGVLLGCQVLQVLRRQHADVDKRLSAGAPGLVSCVMTIPLSVSAVC